ncbi:MAG: Kelch repeat-containing protein, partial [Phycisphaerales bacterium]
MTGLSAAQPLGWDVAATSGPSGRAHAAMAYQVHHATTVLFGGIQSNNIVLDDTWLWNGTSWSEVPGVGPRPAARAAHRLVYDSTRGVCVLFGGEVPGGGLGEHLADTWEWDGTQWGAKPLQGPEGRSLHAMAFDASRGRVVLHGGARGLAYFGDTWEYDGVAWSRVNVAGPGSRASHAMAYDAKRRVTVLFGGGRSAVSGDEVAETWEFDGVAWRQRVAEGPVARRHHAMYFDPDVGGVLVVGGMDAARVRLLGDTWAWDGREWWELPGQPLSARALHAAAYDASRREAIVFGGHAGAVAPVLDDTWRRLADCRISRQPRDQSATSDAPVTFVIEVASPPACTNPVTYQWQRRNPTVADPAARDAWIDLNDGAGIFGSRAPNLTIL